MLHVLATLLTRESELKQLEDTRANTEISDEGTIREYYDLRKQLAQFTDDMQAVTSHPSNSLPFMVPGRLVHVRHLKQDFGWGVLVNYKKRKAPKGPNKEELEEHQSYILDVLLVISDGSAAPTQTFEDLPKGVLPPQEGQETRIEVVPMTLACVQSIAQIRLHLPKDLNSKDARNGVKKALAEAKRRFPDGLAVLDPIEDMGIKDDSFKKLLRVRHQPTDVSSRQRVRRKCSSANMHDRKSRFSSLGSSRTPCITHPGYRSSTTNTRGKWSWGPESRTPRKRSPKQCRSCNWMSSNAASGCCVDSGSSTKPKWCS